MSVANVLNHCYETCEKQGLVGKVGQTGKEAILLPIYHGNIRSDGKNVFEVCMNRKGEVLTGGFLAEGEYSVFPVTEDSVSRSSGAVARPLVDELQYLAPPKGSKKDGLYLKELEKWIDSEQDDDVKRYLEHIHSLTEKADFGVDVAICIASGRKYEWDEKKLELILENRGKNGKISKKTLKLNKLIVTFKVMDFEEGYDRTPTNYRKLQESFIKYQERLNEKKAKSLCNISGEHTYCTTKHRSMMGNAKIITAGTDDSNLETYYGRFTSRSQVVNISYESSYKMHNMLKFLMENRNTSQRLSFKKGKGGEDPAVLCVWFSDDVFNERGATLTKPENTLFGEDEEISYRPGGNATERIKKMAMGFPQKISKEAKAYVMILDKVSNGRISIKYFRELSQGEFYENICNWYDTLGWYRYNQEQKEVQWKSPNLFNLVDEIYGIQQEVEGEHYFIKIPAAKNKYKESLLIRLLPCITEGKPFPQSFFQRAFENIKMRQRYSETWPMALFAGCAAINKYRIDGNRERMDEKLKDIKSQTRSYLYGRVLAILEYLENTSMSKNAEKRESNAARFWNSYTTAPRKTLMLLIEKGQPYWNRLRRDEEKAGLFVIRDKEMQESISRIEAIEKEKNNGNAPLNEDFIFGYYSQKNSFFQPSEKQSKLQDEGKGTIVIEGTEK